MAKTLVVLNPVAGNGAAGKVYQQVEAALRAGGLVFDEARTSGPRDATTIAEEAKHNGYQTIIAVGGDGLAHEVANGMLRASKGEPVETFGLIPIGSGNDFAKMIPLAPDWREGVRRVLAGRSRWFDVGRVTGGKVAPGFHEGAQYFINGLDAGFGALVAMHVHDVPFLHGTAMYLVGILKTLANYYVPRVKIERDNGETLEQTSIMVIASNGRCFGGGFWVTPKAEVDDGLLDVIVADGLGRIGILSLLPKVMQGKHLDDKRIKFFQAKRLIVESPDPLAVETDGEIPYLHAHRLEIDVLPKRLRVIG